ncbi:MAG: hypothetical protein GYA59_08130 [Chloroflexi bacterium]|nr:hypothetical protein [Chloroflexota bacterium]
MNRSIKTLLGLALLAGVGLSCGTRSATTAPESLEVSAGQAVDANPSPVASLQPTYPVNAIAIPIAIEPENASRLVPAGQMNANSPQHIVWSSDSQTVGAATRDGLMLFDANTLAVTANVVVQSPLAVLDFSTGRGIMALSADQHGVEIREITTGEALLSFQSNGTFSRAAFSPNGSLLALARTDQKVVEIWDMDSGALQSTLSGFEPNGAVERLVFSPDGRFLVWQSGNALQAMEFVSEEFGPLLEQEDTIRALAVSADGRFLAVSTAGKVDEQQRPILDLWNPMDGQGLGLLLTGDSFAADVVYNPSSRMLAAAIGPKILLWDMATRQQLAELDGADAEVRALAFSPDGSILSAAMADNTLRLWRVAP